MICSLILRRPLLAKGDERFQARDIVALLKSAVDSKIKDQKLQMQTKKKIQTRGSFQLQSPLVSGEVEEGGLLKRSS